MVVQDAGVCDVLHYDEVAKNVRDEVTWWSHLTIQYNIIQYNKIQYNTVPGSGSSSVRR